MFGFSVGPAAGPCGAVSIYGECMGDTLRICRNRNTMTEALMTTECGSMNAVCRPAMGRDEARCEMFAPPDGGVAEDSGVVTAMDAASAGMDAAGPAADSSVSLPDSGMTMEMPNAKSGCDCAVAHPVRAGGELPVMSWVLLGAVLVARARCRRRRGVIGNCRP